MQFKLAIACVQIVPKQKVVKKEEFVKPAAALDNYYGGSSNSGQAWAKGAGLHCAHTY